MRWMRGKEGWGLLEVEVAKAGLYMFHPVPPLSYFLSDSGDFSGVCRVERSE
jgi:hypothetical protein